MLPQERDDNQREVNDERKAELDQPRDKLLARPAIGKRRWLLFAPSEINAHQRPVTLLLVVN